MKTKFEVHPKYRALVKVFQMAHDRAAKGKGQAHHSYGEEFTEQWICRGARIFGIGGPLYQVGKKNEQVMKMFLTGADKDKLIMELLDIINYSAATVITLQEKE